MPVRRPRKPRLNQVERHPERIAIELAHVSGVTLDKIAARWGVERTAVFRHMAALDPAYKAAMVADVPREELVRRAVEESGTLLDHFKLVRNLTERQLIEAKGCGDSHAVAKLSMAAQEANDRVGKLTGEIQRAMPGIVINNRVAITEQADFRVLETGLLDIASRHPDARGDIVALIRRVRETPPMIEGASDAA